MFRFVLMPDVYTQRKNKEESILDQEDVPLWCSLKHMGKGEGQAEYKP